MQKPNFFTVRGNHEDKVIEALSCPPEQLPKKLRWLRELTQDQVAFLQDIPLTISLPCYEPPVIVVHAGLIPGISLDQQDRSVVTTMRNLHREQEFGPFVAYERKKHGNAWSKHWVGPEHVLFGHDAPRRLQRRKFATGLDTGCAVGGELTACILPEHKIVSVPSKQVSKKEKKGKKK
eukprot:TRINITY_DN5787_c0_g1_i3.p1 TRINITY_DN5787_c0_g1~~TRINITY_DN5787_c0_g1_i3.p1  ORF type:complete len:178 (+),score=26.04 TRINITY_DN5787_c0_g1_i3:260-793(+)